MPRVTQICKTQTRLLFILKSAALRGDADMLAQRGQVALFMKEVLPNPCGAYLRGATRQAADFGTSSSTCRAVKR